MGSEGSVNVNLLEGKGPTLKVSEVLNAETINGVEDESLSDNKDPSKDGSLPPFKKKILISVISLLMIQTLFLNVENVLPLWTADNMPTLSSIELSFILRYLQIITFQFL